MSRRIVTLGLGLVGTALLAALVIRLALTEGLPAPVAAANPLAPNHPALAIAAGRLIQQDPSDALLERMRLVSIQAPLEPEPFLAEAVREGAGNASPQRISLLEEARRRNPRERNVRLVLLDQYVRAGDIAKATAELITLTRLVPDANELLVPQLARLASDSETRDAAKQALAGKPIIDSVLYHLAQIRADPQIILDLAEARDPRTPVATPWQALLVSSLVERGQVPRAYELWRRFHGVAAGSTSTVYDPAFIGRPGSAPFNWTFTTEEIGAAEPDGSGALEIDYFGRTSGTLARQLILLPPGRYRLKMKVEGSENEDGSRLVWSVTCREASAPAVTLDLAGISYVPRVVSATFVIPPAGCGAQWLQLDGVAREFTVAQDAKITEFAIEPVGAGT